MGKLAFYLSLQFIMALF